MVWSFAEQEQNDSVVDWYCMEAVNVGSDVLEHEHNIVPSPYIQGLVFFDFLFDFFFLLIDFVDIL